MPWIKNVKTFLHLWCVPHCLVLLSYAASVASVTLSLRQPPSLVTALVLCRLDYGNSILVGLTVYLQRRLQSVQNAAARLISRLRRSDHITNALVSLHWLRVPERIIYKVAVLTYRGALTGDVRSYHSICGNSSVLLTSLLATDSGPLLPTTWSSRLFDWPPLALALFR